MINTIRTSADTYYFIPEIYDTHKTSYHAQTALDWVQFVRGLDLGVVSYESLRSDYYRVVDSHRFLLMCIQLGVQIDEHTPTIPDEYVPDTIIFRTPYQETTYHEA